MGRFQATLFLALLIGLLGAGAARAQAPIQATTGAELLPELPRTVRFTLEASSAAGNLTEARLFFQPVGSSARVSAPQAFDPAPTLSLSHEWPMQASGIPPGARIEYFWRLTDEAGNEIETPPASIVALDPRFEWQTIEDEELAISWYDGDQGWGQQMFETGTMALAQLEEELGTDITRQVRLVAYRRGEDFRGAFPPQQDWIGGQAFTDLGVTVQIIGAGDEGWMRTVLFHELSHLVFAQAMEGALASAPSWLDEGLAMYNEPESRDSARRVRRAAEDGTLLPFSQLQGNFGADGQVVGLAYAQSEMLVTHLIDECGSAGFQSLIGNLVDEDMTVDGALEAACGYDSQTLYDRWRQTLPNAPTAAPGEAVAVDDVPPPSRWLWVALAGAFCLLALLGVAILVVALRLLRGPKGDPS